MRETETRQDDKAEIAVAQLFRLERVENRMSERDAFDENNNSYQLKGSTKPGISTARSFGPTTIDKLRRHYIVIAWGRNYSDRFEVDRTFFMSRVHIDPWLNIKEDYFNAQIAEAEHILELCRRDGFDDRRLEVTKKRLRNGMLLNDPNIPKRYVLQHGIEITQHYPERLRDLVLEYPLKQNGPTPPCGNIEPFC